ncbi:MAG TPA: winged helix-turn-helix domain-containing protein [Terriglobales bacterium]|nr:winged helix-turn-helix domain-containing protein [Terriglobales bacterium]
MASGSLNENSLFFQRSQSPVPERNGVIRDAPTQYSFGPFHLDRDERLLTRDGIAVPLAPRCFDLLALLLQHAGHLLEKDAIIQTLWPDTFVEEANVSNLVGQLRKALDDSPRAPQFIQTVSKRGYRFVAPVQGVAPARTTPVSTEKSERTAIRIIAFPFRTDSGDGDYLAHSLPDAITSALAEWNAFTVRPTQSAARFDAARWDPKVVANELDVDVILTGTVAHCGERLQITTQLIDASAGTVVWSKVWDVARHDLFQFHNGIVQLLVRSLVRGVQKDGRASMAISAPGNADAYELYLRANHLMLRRTPENVALARDLYLACTEKDPEYAPAWARLGRCYRFLDKFRVEPGGRLRNAAAAAFQRAFVLNPELAIAHSAYTPLEADAGYAIEAMVRLLRVVRANENNPELFAGLVHACRYCGQLDASLAAHRRALALDRNVVTSVAHTYFLLGDYEKTLCWYGNPAGLYLDALALACMDRLKECSALLWTRRSSFSMEPALMNSLQAYLDSDRAKGIAALSAQFDEQGDPEIRFYLARQAARFEDLELACKLLSQSVEQGYSSSAAMTHDSWLQPLHGSSKFKHLLSRTKDREREARLAFEEAGGPQLLGCE